MFQQRFQWVLRAFCAACALILSLGRSSGNDLPADGAGLASQAQAILHKHCFDCHGKNPKKLRGDLNLFDRTHLDDAERKIVVAKAPDKSELISRVGSDDDSLRMPPDPRPRLSDAERKTLHDWVAAGAVAWPVAAPAVAAEPAAPVENLAASVKELLRGNCFDCHGGSRTNAGVKILDRELLVNKKKLVPGKPDESMLFQLVTATDDSVMPPAGRPRLKPDAAELIRRWIAGGAPAFPADVAAAGEPNKDPAFKNFAGVDYVLKKILENVRTLSAEDRRFVRYFSINHILTTGATAAELDLQRDALAKAINHLSWQNHVVRLKAIDPPANTVYALDLRHVGWQLQPFQQWKGGKGVSRADVNIFDLALLEYPYSVAYADSDTFDHLTEEFLYPAGQVRPIPYVRADWFVSTVTLPPLYEDFLQLPFQLSELEDLLGVAAQDDVNDHVAIRAGMAVSGVSRNNRVVQRHPEKYGAFWQSFDFKTSKGRENMFKDPIDLHPTGGEVVFNLPNGLQGYYVTNARGDRLEAAPTEIVTDKFAEDKTVRNGLSCMRCHDVGTKTYADTMRPALLQLPGTPGFDKRLALALYPEQAKQDDLLKEDGDRFLAAMQQALGKPQGQEPLIPVTKRFLDDPIPLAGASGELGLNDPSGLASVFKMPQFSSLGLMPLSAKGVVRRDAWEDYYDQIVRALGLGVPIVPIDGVLRGDYPASAPPFEVVLKTNKKNNSFEPGDDLVVSVVNHSTKPIYIELVGVSSKGRMVILTAPGAVVAAGQEYRYPPEGSPAIKIKPGLGREQITLLAGEETFPAGRLLRGKGLTDRVVHPFYELGKQNGRYVVTKDPARLVKKTIAIETR
ncbi:MAG TPA: hypothetical protein DDY78_20470 [Planctomycetales bacterium]|nr:hypothetical protein [Planctomycetales bacterium]